jgi:hypothetical protein
VNSRFEGKPVNNDVAYYLNVLKQNGAFSERLNNAQGFERLLQIKSTEGSIRLRREWDRLLGAKQEIYWTVVVTKCGEKLAQGWQIFPYSESNAYRMGSGPAKFKDIENVMIQCDHVGRSCIGPNLCSSHSGRAPKKE